MQIRRIGILGGTGFAGGVLANRLVNRGYALRLLTRDRERHKDNLILLPDTELVQTNVHDQAALTACLAGCDAVINLVGILNERSANGSGFHSMHVTLPGKVVQACRANGIRRLLHMSALHADAHNGPSHYLRSKGEGEDLVMAAGDLHVTSYRPSVIFGRDDGLFGRFARLLALTPVAFPLACAQARFAPVYVGDVADAMILTLADPDYYGRRLNLCGPRVYTLQQLVRYTAGCLGLRRSIIPLPDFLGRMQARLFDLGGFAFHLLGMDKPFSMDNYLSTTVDSVCDGGNDLPALVPRPATVETVMPDVLAGHSARSQYDQFRRNHA